MTYNVFGGTLNIAQLNSTPTPSQYVTSHPGQLSLAIFMWVGTMSRDANIHETFHEIYIYFTMFL